jgi:hypothetical protein
MAEDLREVAHLLRAIAEGAAAKLELKGHLEIRACTATAHGHQAVGCRETGSETMLSFSTSVKGPEGTKRMVFVDVFMTNDSLYDLWRQIAKVVFKPPGR